ncbi:MAG: MATE family efflux transporter, partial [Candidatus Obscuribacterales bacterium]|nr:MATE family efflux transporter [Candidatus Obscuribacterales bacterium]
MDAELDENTIQESLAEATASKAPLVEGSLWRAIWIMSWPLMISTITSSIVGAVDIQVAGILGSAAQAAVGLAEQVLFLFQVLIMSVGVGTTAIVSRAVGAGDMKEATIATAQSLALSVMLGLTLVFAALFTASFLLPFFKQDAEVIVMSQRYLSIICLLLFPFSIIALINATFRSIGDAKTPLLVMCVIATVNIAGDYITVLGNWPIPGLGIKGIAASGVVASLFGSLIALWALKRSKLKECLQHFFPLSLEQMLRVLRIGIPSTLQRISWIGGTFVLFLILSYCPNPTQSLASWSIGMRVESFVFMPLMALSMAVASIVGQSLGAKEFNRAFKAGWHVTNLGIGLMLCLATLMFVFARPFAETMSHDPKTIEYTIDYLRINAFSEPFLSVGMVLAGALQGAGETRGQHARQRRPLLWQPTGAWRRDHRQR